MGPEALHPSGTCSLQDPTRAEAGGGGSDPRPKQPLRTGRPFLGLPLGLLPSGSEAPER